MGDSVEQWRATIGLWSGGRPRRCVTSQHHIAQNSNHIGYKYIRFLVLVSLLVIGCVELNPGPDHETSAPTQSAGALPKFRRRPGTDGLHGQMYEVKMAAFLFARALNSTEEFRLASNVDGAGAFDDLVFRYRLRESDVWKTCFIQLKHKKIGGTIQRSSLTQMSGDFSLLKYFKSFCEIKNNAATDPNMKECGPFVDFEFVIYTNGKMESKSPLQGGDPDPLSILSSGTDYGKYVCFDETRDIDIFGFFEELSIYHEIIQYLNNMLGRETTVDEDIISMIEKNEIYITNNQILERLKKVKLNLNNDYVTTMFQDVSKCDFSIIKEFLSKIKIFQNQIHEKSLQGLIEKELQQACKAPPSVANFIYEKFKVGLSEWLKQEGNIKWLNENSRQWQVVQKHITSEIKETSESEIQEIVGCGIRFNEKHVQKLTDAIKQNSVLNIVTNSKVRILQKLKTYQALNNFGYKNSLFIGINSLMFRCRKIHKMWPCKWSEVLVADCDSNGNVANTVMDILQQSTDHERGLNTFDENSLETLEEVLQKYQQKMIIFSTRQMASGFQEKLQNNSYFEDNCDISDLNEMSQWQILETPVNFQGTNVALSTLIGTDPPESIKALLDSDVISILLSNEHELSVGRQLGDHCKYYVPRVLQHQIHLKEEILKLIDYAITFAVSGLQAEELKDYLPAGEKIWEFLYDKNERNHTFKIVYDFSKFGISAELGTMKAHQKARQEMKSDDVMYNQFWNKNTEINVSEDSYFNSFSTVAKFPMYCPSNELENMEDYNEEGQIIKPEEVRYIILGNKNSESEFRELKKLCRKVHWIHVEDGSFLWRDTNCNIDIIRRYIDNTKCEKYDMQSVMEHNGKTMILVADPGMGKSTFLSYLALEIKKCNPSVWVLRINLIEHTKELEDAEFKQQSINNFKTFLWNAAHSPEQEFWNLTKEIFLQALDQTGKMVIILDGFDELSAENRRKVEMLIGSIREGTASKIWISSRLSYQKELEDIVGNFAFTLEPFTTENQIEFLVQYWSEVTRISNQEILQKSAKRLISLCPQNFSDKSGEFTGIPLQTMMLGEAFVNEAKEYCCSEELKLPKKINLLSLFKNITEKKYNIYLKKENKMDTSKPEVECGKKDSIERHMISALLYLFSRNEIIDLLGQENLKQTKLFLLEDETIKFGLIRDSKDGKPNFIHRCFAEYLAAEWFADNFIRCKEFISDILLKSTNWGIRNIFDGMLAENYDIHESVLNNDIHALKEILKTKKDINTLDKGGRTALHLAASYNSPCIQELLSFPGIDANKPDKVLEWTPLRYADRTKSWMAMDTLLQNDANLDDIVLTKHKAKVQEWGQAACWECASKGHIKLLEFMLNCGIQVNARVEVPENHQQKCTLLHRASYCDQLQVVTIIVNRGADVNIREANKNSALHLGAESGSVEIIKLLLDKGMSVNVTNSNDSTPLHISADFGHLEATKTLVGRGADINYTDKYGKTPLMLAAHKGKLEILRYLTEKGADINTRDDKKVTALHLASASGSVDIIKLLLDKGMSVNLTNSNDSTPLHISSDFGHLEATKTLVARGAVINNTNKYGKTPLMLAARKGKLEILRYLTEKGADINTRDANKITALHLASASGSVDSIKLLLDKGMCVNLTDTDEFTPLHVSAQFGHLEATKILLERDADINNRDAKNDTALHLAAAVGSVDIIKLLLDKGMSVNLTRTDKFTPLHVSAQFGHLEATKTLVERGAAINSTNRIGKTPLNLAIGKGHLEVRLYLTKIGADNNIHND